MKKNILVLSVLVLASSFAGAAALAANDRISGRKTISRPLARPAARAANARPSSRKGFAAASPRSGFAAVSSGKGHTAAFAKTKRLTAGDGTTPAQFTYGDNRPPVYSNPGNGGTHSVDGGGFVAIDPSRAVDVGRSPGITLGAMDRTTPSASGGAGSGSGGSSNGPAFNPSF